MSIDSDPSSRPAEPTQTPEGDISHGQEPVTEAKAAGERGPLRESLVSREAPTSPTGHPALAAAEAAIAQPQHESFWRQKWVWVTGSVLGATALAAGGFFLSQNSGDHKGNAPISDPKKTSETQPTPTETYKDVPTAEQLAQYNIPANATPEQMAQIYTQMQSDMRGGILRPSTYDEWMTLTATQGMSAQDAANKIASDWLTPFFNAQYETNYKTTPSLSDQYGQMLTKIAGDVKNYTGSTQESYTLASVTTVSSSAQERQLQITQTEEYLNKQDPSDPNNTEANGRQGTQTVTFTLSPDGSKWLVSDWH